MYCVESAASAEAERVGDGFEDEDEAAAWRAAIACVRVAHCEGREGCKSKRCSPAARRGRTAFSNAPWPRDSPPVRSGRCSSAS